MKALILCTLAGVAGLAAEGCESRAAHVSTRPDKPARVEVTGSHIPRPVRRVGNTYDGPQAVHVIDRERIEQSGENTLAGVLRRYPPARVR